MLHHEVTDQVSLLIALCFSFFIFVFTICMKDDRPVHKCLGLIFIVPFGLSALAIVMAKKASFSFLRSLPEPALLFCILFILIAGWKKIRKVNGSTTYKLLFPACSTMATAVAVQALIQQLMSPYIYLFLKLSSYMLFLLYFRNELTSRLLGKVQILEEKLSVFNRELDVEVKKRTMEIENVNKNLVNMAKTDPLSKVLNRQAVLGVVETLIETEKGEFSILLFDIDDFKTINDTFGHIDGDKCIMRLSKIARDCIREIDIIGRYGGDEFIIVIPGTNASQARYIAERLRKKAEDVEDPHFTISAGIASYPYDAVTVKELVIFADKGLYLSKKRGKNRVSHITLF